MTDTQNALALEGPLTIYGALELKGRLMDAVNSNQELSLDLSRVTELDTAGLQMLYLAKREASRLCHDLRIVAHSAAVREVFDLVNMNAYFGDPTLIPAQE
jgi:ABC-type transporter Mla MlaB component